MSQNQAEAQGGHHDAHHDGHDAHGAAHGSMRGYVTGFLLSVVLTAIPFWLVMNDVLGNSTLTAIVIMLFAAAQIVVHMVYFLHMNGRSEGGWTMLALIFTIIVVAIALAGSLWVMFHLNANMMPDMHRM
ncbi:cytochrome o ubiquinol oxidase subunit IV [Bosea sp. CCNWLW174]|jgi:cytochrome o ubiquinol oxidase operon protein cyoD|uniref:cytochrome o ubiquinol oxidase subunit IV n=1 Tax=unclassified Bosea (in: a-proteobacteria) TaxID=2653178 RepID=UPI000C304D8A|nr:cytochrome o ubiquinol oxidase subunit IV [Bosea sp. FBZP-16]